MAFPVKVYFPRASRGDGRQWAKDEANKVVTARDQAELDALKRIGWSTEPPKEK